MLFIVVWRADVEDHLVRCRTFRSLASARRFATESENECELYTCGGSLVMHRESITDNDA